MSSKANQRQSMELVHRNKKNRGMKTKSMQLPGPSLATIESLAIPLVQEVVFLADFRCAKCQQRVAEVMAKMNGETDSVVVSVLEKKVTLTCRYPTAAADRAPATQVASTYWTSFAPILRLFLSTCR